MSLPYFEDGDDDEVDTLLQWCSSFQADADRQASSRSSRRRVKSSRKVKCTVAIESTASSRSVRREADYASNDLDIAQLNFDEEDCTSDAGNHHSKTHGIETPSEWDVGLVDDCVSHSERDHPFPEQKLNSFMNGLKTDLNLYRIARPFQRMQLQLCLAKLVEATARQNENESRANRFRACSLRRKTLIGWRDALRQKAEKEKSVVQARRYSQLRLYFFAWRGAHCVEREKIAELLQEQDDKLKVKVLKQWAIATSTSIEAAKVANLVATAAQLNRQRAHQTSCFIGWRSVVSRILKQRQKEHRQGRVAAFLDRIESTPGCAAAEKTAIKSLSKDKENSPNACQSPNPQTRNRKPTLVINMERRRADQSMRRNAMKRRYAEAQRQREEVAREVALREEAERLKVEEAESRGKFDKKRANALLLEERKGALKMASLHYKMNLLRRHLDCWKGKFQEVAWKDRKAYALWHDASLQQSFNQWKQHLEERRRQKHKIADQHLQNRLFQMWRARALHVGVCLHDRVEVEHANHARRRVMAKWTSACERQAKVSAWMKETAQNRGRISKLRWALARWKKGVAMSRRERAIEERLVAKRRDVKKWLEATADQEARKIKAGWKPQY